MGFFRKFGEPWLTLCPCGGWRYNGIGFWRCPATAMGKGTLLRMPTRWFWTDCRSTNGTGSLWCCSRLRGEAVAPPLNGFLAARIAGTSGSLAIFPGMAFRSPSSCRCAVSFLQVRRFFCDNDGCSQHIFTERPAETAPRYARRTARLSVALEQITRALGGSAWAHLAQQLGIPASGSTLLRQLRRKALDTSVCRFRNLTSVAQFLHLAKFSES